jgi:hypothetical protein
MAIHIRESKVQQNGIWRTQGGQAKGFFAAIGVEREIARCGQAGGQNTVDPRLVINH